MVGARTLTFGVGNVINTRLGQSLWTTPVATLKTTVAAIIAKVLATVEGVSTGVWQDCRNAEGSMIQLQTLSTDSRASSTES